MKSDGRKVIEHDGLYEGFTGITLAGDSIRLAKKDDHPHNLISQPTPDPPVPMAIRTPKQLERPFKCPPFMRAQMTLGNINAEIGQTVYDFTRIDNEIGDTEYEIASTRQKVKSDEPCVDPLISGEQKRLKDLESKLATLRQQAHEKNSRTQYKKDIFVCA
jgi:hypothetical protein